MLSVSSKTAVAKCPMGAQSTGTIINLSGKHGATVKNNGASQQLVTFEYNLKDDDGHHSVHSDQKALNPGEQYQFDNTTVLNVQYTTSGTKNIEAVTRITADGSEVANARGTCSFQVHQQ